MSGRLRTLDAPLQKFVRILDIFVSRYSTCEKQMLERGMSNVFPLPTARGTATPLDLFLRVGEAHYRQVASLYTEGRLPIRRAIFDASKLKHQLDFAKTLREDRVELILDTKAAELAAPSRYQGRPSGAPWADGVLHLPHQFDEARCRAFAEAIARDAVEKQFDRVLAPTHFLKEGVLDLWFRIDIRLCQLLRDELDRHGGAHVAIDYVVIIEQSKLRDEAVRAALLHQLAPLPFENVMFRTSHFGSDASATGIRAFINTLDRFHNFGHPVIVDHVGGTRWASAARLRCRERDRAWARRTSPVRRNALGQGAARA